MARTLPIKLRTLAAAVVVIASGLIIFYAYQSIINATDDTGGTLPIIAADIDPFRMLPDNPGGAEIPNQGSELFKVLSADNADALALDGIKIENEPENILDAPPTDNQSTGFALPEIPESRTESLYSLIDDLKIDNDNNDQSAPPVIKDEDKQELKEKLRNAIEQVEQRETVAVVDDAPPVIEDVEKNSDAVVDTVKIIPLAKPVAPVRQAEIKPKTESASPLSVEKLFEQAPPPAPTVAPIAVKKYHYIQLASVQNEADARALYARIRNDFPNLVRGLSVSFPKADLGARGTFTRIQIGPLDTQVEAKKRCADYTSSARGGTCLVVSR